MKKMIFSLLSIFLLSVMTAYASPYEGYDITNKERIYKNTTGTIPAFPKQGDKIQDNYM